MKHVMMVQIMAIFLLVILHVDLLHVAMENSSDEKNVMMEILQMVMDVHLCVCSYERIAVW